MTEPLHDPPRWREQDDQWGTLARDLALRCDQGPLPEQQARMAAALDRRAASTLSAGSATARKLVGLAIVTGVLVALYAAWPTRVTQRAAPRGPVSNAVAAPATVLPQPSASPVPDSGSPESSSVDATPRTRAPAPRKRAFAKPAPVPPEAEARDPIAELALLTRARRVLLSSPERTLALSDEHQRLYPRGAFAEERELLALEALIRLGDRAAAKRRGETFLRDHAGSAHVVRVRDLLKTLPAAPL